MDTAKETSRKPSFWRRLTRFSLSHGRLTRRRLDSFAAGYASEASALIVHSDDLDWAKYYPNAFHVSHRPSERPDLLAETDYVKTLATVPSQSRDLIVCTGLLEHLPDPALALDEFARILKSGGTLLLSASGVFSYHGGSDNFFHFAPGGLRQLFDDRFEIVELRGSTGPFETLGVLAQRINLQCDVFPPVRLLIEALCRILPLFEYAVLRQYNNTARTEPSDPRIGIMPATLMAVVRKNGGAT